MTILSAIAYGGLYFLLGVLIVGIIVGAVVAYRFIASEWRKL